jgi:putative oxidoreductase
MRTAVLGIGIKTPETTIAMKYVPSIVGALLGLLFIASSVYVLSGKAPMDKIPEGTPPFHFMAALGPTGYMTFIKVCELLGGILTAIPKTRNFGLLLLGPIIVNILAFHHFVAKDLFAKPEPMVYGIAIAALYLLWAGRRNFAALKN